jgi:L-alanine-DL-glutamate epimerase-like enolase superfamily enzyme
MPLPPRRALLKILPTLAVFAQNPIVAQSRKGTSPLKIVKVEAFVIRTPNDGRPANELIDMPPVGALTGGAGLWNRLDHASPSRFFGHTQAVLVKVTTDQDLIGWGECHAPAAPRVHQTVVSDLLTPVLLGQNALDIEPLWEKMYSTQRLRGYSDGFFTEAIAGVDIALWDILGKFTGQPLYQLLGGKYRAKIPTYVGIGGASIAQLKDNAAQAVAQGYGAVKMSLSKGQGTSDLNRVLEVAESIRGKGQLLVDSLGGYKLYEAVKVGRELDRAGVGWWEDPLTPDDTESYPKLADALDTPIVAGEELCNRFQFRDMFAKKSVDIVNPDVCRAAGITEMKRIAILADAHEVMWAPHVSTGTAPYVSASIHLACATPNFLIMEGGNIFAGPLGNVLLKQPFDWTPGFATVPERPGLGVEFDEKELKKVIA